MVSLYGLEGFGFRAKVWRLGLSLKGLGSRGTSVGLPVLCYEH